MIDSQIEVRNEALRLFHRWRETDAKVCMYGVSMPQSKKIIADFFRYLEDIVTAIPSFSVVKSLRGFEIVVHTLDETKDLIFLTEASENSLQTIQTFDALHLQSITFHPGLTVTDLEHLFAGLHLLTDTVTTEDGLAGYLRYHHVQHIELNRLCFIHCQDSVSDTSSIGTDRVSDAPLTLSEDPYQCDPSDIEKTFVPIWERFLSGQLDSADFHEQHQDLITLAQEKPEMFIRALQRMAAKQAQIEAFLANLEQKLFDLGFPETVIQRIMNSLHHPKQVLVDEAELARLRQIERDCLPDLTQRIERSLTKIDTLQKTLLDERERGDAILRQTGQGIMVINRNGQIIGLNPIASKALGFASDKEALGRQFGDIIQEHHVLTLVSEWDQETEDHVPKNVELQGASTDVIETMRESAIVIEDENGRSVGSVFALHDVLVHRDLERRKNDILDVLGHDLRAPLNIVKQNIALITDFLHQPDKLPASEQEKFLMMCMRHIERMEKLINKILDVRQLETGKIVLKKIGIPMTQLIEDAALSLESWARDKNITISVATESLPELHCDPERLYEVITNLVSNALKFTPSGSQVYVRGKTIKIQGTEMVEVSVKDSGMGIQEKDLERIFNKYEQVSLRRPGGTSGLGLGLSVCKTIIDMHGGLIWAKSTVGQGSTFIFRIPVCFSQKTAH